MELGYTQSEIDPCLYHRQGLILAKFPDECIMVAKSIQKLEEAMEELAG